jgi:asparagine synthase (glutamine-hydrolysing)
VPAWCTAAAADLYRSAFAERREPVRWDRRTRTVLDNPAAQVLFPNVRACIADEGLHPILPFVDAEFLASLAAEGGPLGLGGRSLIFDRLVGDLLPREVVFRRTKASFNETRWGEAERDFARSWDGSGADDRWIDAEKLQAEWLHAAPHPTADFLLHVAWAASNGGDVGMAAAGHEDDADEPTDPA